MRTRRKSAIFCSGLAVLAGLSTAPWAKAPRPGTPGPPMTLAEANRLIEAGGAPGWLRVTGAVRAGSLEASPAEAAAILHRVYFAARASGEDAKPFHGGQPLPHTEAQIAAIVLLGEMPPERGGQAIAGIAQTFLGDLEALAPERRRQSPLQAIQAPLARVLLLGAESPATAGVASRFAESPAVAEYARWEIAVALLEHKVAASPAEASTIVLSSFRGTTVPELRQFGKRVNTCCALLAERPDLDEAPLERAILEERAASPPERYFAAACLASRLASRLEAGGKPGDRDDRRVEAILAVLEGVRTTYGENRYAAKPLERAVESLGRAAAGTGLGARITRALEGR